MDELKTPYHGNCLKDTCGNEWVASNHILEFAQGFPDAKMHDFDKRSSLFRCHFIQMDLCNVYSREAYFFVWLTMKYLMKSTD